MPNTAFDEFVKRQQAAKAAASVDWNQQRDEWLRYLKELYDRIESFLESYKTAGQAQIGYREIPLNEEDIGSYMAKEMILKIGPQEIIFTPRGTLFIGLKGRVDVRGPLGTGILALVNNTAADAKPFFNMGARQLPSSPPPPAKEIEWAWMIASSPPNMRFSELTQEAFFEMVLAVANA